VDGSRPVELQLPYHLRDPADSLGARDSVITLEAFHGESQSCYHGFSTEDSSHNVLIRWSTSRDIKQKDFMHNLLKTLSY
jgi:hypothetical protein